MTAVSNTDCELYLKESVHAVISGALAVAEQPTVCLTKKAPDEGGGCMQSYTNRTYEFKSIKSVEGALPPRGAKFIATGAEGSLFGDWQGIVLSPDKTYFVTLTRSPTSPAGQWKISLACPISSDVK
jgi:hypothetical protein